jgi:hypothetical protein
MATLQHLERNTDLLLQLMQHLDCRVSEEELRAIAAEKQLARRMGAAIPDAPRAPTPS